jgi:hypothetical protein
MLGTKEKYVLAMATLFLIGLSTAWAGYNGISTISTGTIQDFAQVTPNKPTITLSGLKKNVWFYNTTTDVFFINATNTSAWVRVGVLNMAEIADDFKALDINVTLKVARFVSGSSGQGDWDVISLEAGTSSVLLNATVSSGSVVDFAVDLYISGRPAGKDSATISVYCAVEPAEGVVQA